MTDRSDHAQPNTGALLGPTLRRRGMLGAVAALAAGGLAKATATPALAGTDGDLVLGATNTLTAQNSQRTLLKVGVAPFSDTTVFQVDATPSTFGNAVAIVAFGSHAGTNGTAAVGVSAFGGHGNASFGAGAAGVAASGGSGAGASGPGGAGLVAQAGAGSAPNGNGGIGVQAFGAGGVGTGSPGMGVQGTGGGAAPNQGSGVVGLTNANANPAVSGQNSGNGQGVYGVSTSGVGTQGTSSSNIGVYGNSSSGVGVWGDTSTSSGVTGRAVSGTGVFGQSTSGQGVHGESQSGYGVFGSSVNQVGIYGTSTNSFGIYGSTNNTPALYGTSNSGTGVQGESATGYAIYGHSAVGNAGRFDGSVVVNGTFTVLPGFAKSGSVAFADGSVRRLYAMESPDSWFEDFGEAQLVNGRASVPIPPDFAQAVNTATSYHVFLTGYSADIEALNVTVRAPDHFEVQANGKGVVEGGFAYRIVAKRKDLAAPRFDRVAGLNLRAAAPADAAPLPPAVAPKLPEIPAASRQIPMVTAPPESPTPSSSSH